jgi:hypothetical protein
VYATLIAAVPPPALHLELRGVELRFAGVDGHVHVGAVERERAQVVPLGAAPGRTRGLEFGAGARRQGVEPFSTSRFRMVEPMVAGSNRMLHGSSRSTVMLHW